MGKVKEMAARNNKKPSAAMARAGSGEMTERQTRLAAIQQMSSKGFAFAKKQAEEFGEHGEEASAIDKEKLVGVPFVILDAHIRESEKYNGLYATCHIILENGKVGFFHASGEASGIVNQLDGMEISPEKPHFVPGGLKASRYDNRHTGTPSVTYYLSYPADVTADLPRGNPSANGRRATATA